MSQRGAYAMAMEGFDYDEILEFYFTDIDIY
jgi:SpoIID/LytB domain protein